MLGPSLVIAFLSITTALAAPTLVKVRADPQPFNTASCSHRNVQSGGNDSGVGDLDEYSVRIGRPFVGGTGCEPIRRTLFDMVPSARDFTCDDDGAGGTQLVFTTISFRSTHYDVTDAMQKAYPDVPFVQKHYCD